MILLAGAAIPARLALKSRAKSHPDKVELLPVAAVKVTREDLARVQVFDAEFRPNEEIDLYSKVAGFLETITVDMGDQVKAGQKLATLEIPELQDDLDRALAVARRSAEEVKKAQADYEETHLAYTRLLAVDKAQPHLMAPQDLDLAQSKDRAAEASLAAAKQQVEVANAETKKLRTMLGYCQITAPFGGVISKRFVDPGALIHGGGSSSAPLVRLSQNDRLRLVFPVSVSFVSFIKIGDPVEIRVSSPERKLTGQISRFTRKIETSTRTMEVEVDVPNSDLRLIPGMYASVAVRLENREKALVLPVEAVSRQSVSTVFLIGPNGQIEERTVTLGLETPAKLEVLSGLKENDLVMIGSRAQVKPGQTVEPKIMAKEESR